MTKDEFDYLRSIEKKIIDDIIYSQTKTCDHIFEFNKIKVINPTGFDLFANGRYNKKTRRIIFNFVVPKIGPICRLELNGTEHGDAGRNHKHEIVREKDSRRNLPHAYPLQTYPFNWGAQIDIDKIWKDFCSFANIVHTGIFNPP